jgi:hypothetical protein
MTTLPNVQVLTAYHFVHNQKLIITISNFGLSIIHPWSRHPERRYAVLNTKTNH